MDGFKLLQQFALFNFIPEYCPVCGAKLGGNLIAEQMKGKSNKEIQQAISAYNNLFMDKTMHSCDCELLEFAYADTDDILKAHGMKKVEENES